MIEMIDYEVDLSGLQNENRLKPITKIRSIVFKSTVSNAQLSELYRKKSPQN